MKNEMIVSNLPQCDFCGKDAEYDFSTVLGPWANGCEKCYKKYRRHAELGIGKGQKLILKSSLLNPED
jgi:hypothetical protein